jgi:hypothetical protein
MKKENALLFNVLPFLSDKLLTEGNTVATLESLYEKYVPVETQEYLDSKRKPTPVRLRPKRSANATTPMATTIKEENGNG